MKITGRLFLHLQPQKNVRERPQKGIWPRADEHELRENAKRTFVFVILQLQKTIPSACNALRQNEEENGMTGANSTIAAGPLQSIVLRELFR